MSRAALPIVVLIMATVASARAAATKPATTDPLIEAAAAAAEAGTLASFVGVVDAAASEALPDPATADLSRVSQLATLRQFGRWFSRVSQATPEQKAAMTWLIRQGRAAPALMLSATTFDPPDRALAILSALYADQRDRLEQYPELTAAICLVWDDPERFGGEGRTVEASRVVGVFRHYADNRGATRNAADELPVEQLVFVVDNMLSGAEIDWVRRQYAQPTIGEAFFEVGYGRSRNLTREPKPGDDPDNAYTLANLRRFGGNLADQSYYAAQIGKALGVPTATCVGLVREGQESQSWVAFLQGRGRDARWDTTTGRYRMHGASPGEVVDPQMMENVPLGELALVAGVARTAPSKRAGAAALCKLLDRVPPDKQLEALKRAVELSPSDRHVWRRVAEWGAQVGPTKDEHREAVSLIMSQLMPQSEELALHLRMEMMAKLAAADRSAALAELRPAFDRRPGLAASIQLERARALLETKDADGALRVLGELIAAVDTVPTHAVSAMRIVDDVLRERSDLDRLARIYEQLWARMRAPAQSPVAHTTPYFAIGQEYAQLLEELGRKHDLASVRERLGQLYAEPVRR